LVALLTLASIAGASQTNRTTDVSYQAALAVNTGLPLRTPTGGAADLSSGAATSVVETGFVGITAGPATAVVRATLTIPTAGLARIITAGAVGAGVACGTTHTGAG
jgi:hypothetical protein